MSRHKEIEREMLAYDALVESLDRFHERDPNWTPPAPWAAIETPETKFKVAALGLARCLGWTDHEGNEL